MTKTTPPRLPGDYRLTADEAARLIASAGTGLRGEFFALLGQYRPIRDKYASIVDAEDPPESGPEVNNWGIPVPILQFLNSSPAGMFPVQEQAIRWARPVRGVQPNWRHLGLMIVGPQLGKSTAAAMTIHNSHSYLSGITGRFIAESVLMRILSSKDDREQRRLRGFDRLVVDRMGYSTSGGARGYRDVMEFLLLRWEAGRQNVLTSRLLGMSAWSKAYGPEAWASLERYCTVAETQPRG